MICPKEFNCPLVENPVARIFSSTCSFIHASKTGSFRLSIKIVSD